MRVLESLVPVHFPTINRLGDVEVLPIKAGAAPKLWPRPRFDQLPSNRRFTASNDHHYALFPVIKRDASGRLIRPMVIVAWRWKEVLLVSARDYCRAVQADPSIEAWAQGAA